jgi:hypothetical protein
MSGYSINNEEKKGILNMNHILKVYEKTQETLALLKILSMSSKNIESGKAKDIKETFADIRKEIGIRK